MTRGFFITGTDTDVGKTVVSIGLMAALKNQGLTVAAFKPVSAGCTHTKHGLRNDDALQLMQQASIELPYDIVNPYAFEPAIAPHIAAAEINVEMNIDTLVQAYQKAAAEVDVVIVEGAGGWLVPLNKNKSMADLASALQLDVIQVVGLKLGCLNHALLTAESIFAQGLTQTSWVANQCANDMPYQKDNIHSLQRRLPGECLGMIPNIPQIKASDIAQHLNIESLL